MQWKTPIVLLSIAMLAAPAANAVSISYDGEDPTTLAVDGATDLPFTVTVDCVEDLLLAGSASAEVTVTIPDAPAWLNFTDATLTFDGTNCITGASQTISQGGTLSVTPDASAPGMVPTGITLDADGATADANIQVDYKPGYSFDVEGNFPMEVPADGTSFPATIHLFGNARSMAMFEVLERPECVSVSGVPDFYTAQDADLAGDMEEMVPLTISVTPCGGEWTEDKFVFKTWSHFLDAGEMKTEDVEITWTFQPAADTVTEGEEGSPGFGLVGLLAALGAAFIVRRRR